MGKYSPTEIVKAAKFLGIEAIAITDYMSVQGLDEANKIGKKLGIYVVPGIEIPVRELGQIEKIIGYGEGLRKERFIKSLKNAPLSTKKTIQLIKDYQGISVLSYSERIPSIIELLIDMGLDGVEVIHPCLTKKEQIKWKMFARKHRLLLFGGSNFQGSSINNSILLGLGHRNLKNVDVPYGYFTRGILGIKQAPLMEGVTDVTKLTLEEKLGLIIKPGFEWPIVNDKEDQRLINTFGIGLNKINKDRITDIDKLQSYLSYIINISSVPVMLTINQEGGRLNTIDWENFILFAGNRAIGALNDDMLAYEVGVAIGQQLRSLGITWNLAPVCDVLDPNNPSLGNRCFSEDPKKVALLASSFIKGMQEQGVAATAKHFPGLGHSNVDSHIDIPIIPSISPAHLIPFIEAIKANVSSIMVSNLIVKDIDPFYPAFMSKKVIDYLRQDLGFNGVIITENISIPILNKVYGDIGKIAVRAFEVGADIILIDPDFSKEKYDSNAMQKSNERSATLKIKVYEALKQSILTGKISEQRLNESVKRVWMLRKTFGINKLPDISLNKLNKIHTGLAKKISNRCLTVFKDKGNIVPLRLKLNEKILVFNILPMKQTRADSSWKSTSNIKKILNYFPGHYFEIDLRKKEIPPLFTHDKYIIIGTYDLYFCDDCEIKSFCSLLNILSKHNKIIVHVALGTPQDLMIGRADLSIALYNPYELSIESLSDFLKVNWTV
ncbi:glycoside hydrolase family 3 N-terminal domain-containing protein [Thermoflavimicrobium daqui]|uniref:beta-N-acetylhexosaminidase n=1 Tax=Thermoflavimicrobium daqui TaxID=2137476 RepID=A0A364K6Q1_9BACL|nr:glycoside hydrolase family 3 N-terminal domain-containing protein [Thermoflavimicrobium daqui]RAL25957.1 hypothetical protein DL897_07770 [Thermoflavimicrobium daqui]